MFHQPIAVGIGQTVRAQPPSHITAQRFHNIPGYRLDTGAKTPIQPGQCRMYRLFKRNVIETACSEKRAAASMAVAVSPRFNDRSKLY